MRMSMLSLTVPLLALLAGSGASIAVIGACVSGSAFLARFMVRRRKQQPLGTATRMKTPNAEADFEMHMTDKGDFNLGSGRPAEDQYGSYRAPSL